MYIDISGPAIVALYNKGMCGVDLADMMMELYKINNRSTFFIVAWEYSLQKLRYRIGNNSS